MKPNAFLLITFTAFGLWGAGRLSIDQYASGTACPILGAVVPACYVALLGYILISAGILLRVCNKRPIARCIFWTGMTLAGGLALLATVMEIFMSNICPVGPLGIPTCYLSLLLSASIAWFFLRTQATRQK